MDMIATTERHTLPEGELTLLGAVDEVVGAMTRVDMGGRRILIDCGKPIGRDAHGWTLPREAEDCDALILTHGHADHVSGLPSLLATGWEGPIYGTRATLELTKMNARDTVRFSGGSKDDIRAFEQTYDQLTR